MHKDFKVSLAPKHLNTTFIEITKENKWIKTGELYNIVDRPPMGTDFQPNFIATCLLVEKQRIHRTDITEHFARLDKNCSIKIYNDILDHKGHDKDQYYSVLTFSKSYSAC